jgi:hypothetical protein
MSTRATYTIERWPLGWLLCSPPSTNGIHMGAMSECLGMFPKDVLLFPGIAHHFNASGDHLHVVVCVASKTDGQAWEAEITESLKDAEPHDRWWMGVDVGTSSAALFAVLAPKNWQWCADYMGRQSAPLDASDFGRCLRLVNAFPGWRERLLEVAEKYAATRWPRIIARWDALAAASPEEQTRILREINS